MNFTIKDYLKDVFFCLLIRLNIIVSVSRDIYEAKFDIYQINATISFQVFKNKLQRKDIVLQPMLQYEG